MNIEKNIADQNLIIKAIQQNKMDKLIDFSYNIARTYLTHQYNFFKLPPHNTLSIDDIAINISASLFHKDKSGKIQFIPEYLTKENDSVNEVDVKFYVIKTIQQRIDHEIGITEDLLAVR